MANTDYAKWFRDRYAMRRAYAINKLGGKCIKCGTTDNLEFDHINPATKTKKIDQCLMLTLENLDRELAKCQLLCNTHHLEKTSNENKASVCKNGHPRTGSNLMKDRHCRTCQNEATRNYKRRKRARLSQLAEEADLKSAKSGFESQDGHTND